MRANRAGCGGQHVGWTCAGIVCMPVASSVLTDTLCASGPKGRFLGAREAFARRNEHGPEHCGRVSGNKCEDRAQVERRKGLTE